MPAKKQKKWLCETTLTQATYRTPVPYLALIRGEGQLARNRPILVIVTKIEENHFGPHRATATVVSSPAKKSSDFAVGKTIRITNFPGIVKLDISGVPSVPSAGSVAAAIARIPTP
jgi:hypothetical protein